MKKKLLVTGGAGFIGSAVVDRALIKGYRVINVDSLTYAGSKKNISNFINDKNHEFVLADVRSRDSIANIFSKYKPDALIHLAAETHVDRSLKDPTTFADTNINGTLSLLEVVRSYLSKKGSPENFRFINVSTDEVYGSLKGSGKFTEVHPHCPSSPYSASKAAAEDLVNAWIQTYGLPAITTRCSNNFGPRQYPEKLVPLTIANAFQLRPIEIYGNGQNVRDWIYVLDHADALLEILSKGRSKHCYNIGANAEFTNNDLVDLICKIMDKLRPMAVKHANLVTFIADRPGHDYRYALNTDKIETELSWKPKFSFERSLHETVKWYLDQFKSRSSWVKNRSAQNLLKHDPINQTMSLVK